MARSWGHRAERMLPEVEAFYRERGYHCSATGCLQVPLYAATYEYVTGRSGRASESRRHVCPYHAVAFAKKHGLQLEVTEPQVAPRKVRFERCAICGQRKVSDRLVTVAVPFRTTGMSLDQPPYPAGSRVCWHWIATLDGREGQSGKFATKEVAHV